jgi:putative membrane protein
MLATKVFVGLLGILLAFSPDAIYGFYERQPGYWGLSPGTDQSVGGLIMALEQSIVMGVALVFLFTRALSESEREAKRTERLEDDAEAAADAARRAAVAARTRSR